MFVLLDWVSIVVNFFYLMFINLHIKLAALVKTHGMNGSTVDTALSEVSSG